MKCPNCGAELKAGKCDYCGYDTAIRGKFNGGVGQLVINGKTYDVYLSNIKEHTKADSYRDENGVLYNRNFKIRTFEFTEMEGEFQ